MKLRSSVYGWKSVWMEFAEERSGSFDEGSNVFVMRVPVQGKPFTITFNMRPKGHKGAVADTTTAFLPYKAKGAFSFALHNRSWIEDASKIFGAQDIEVGDQQFDHDYIIKGSDKDQVARLFGNEKLKELITEQKSLKLSIHDEPKELAEHGNVPPGIHVLAFNDTEAINSFDRLNQVYDLMVELAEQLITIDAASAQDPNFDL